jgi:hypothetical protein
VRVAYSSDDLYGKGDRVCKRRERVIEPMTSRREGQGAALSAEPTGELGEDRQIRKESDTLDATESQGQE